MQTEDASSARQPHYLRGVLAVVAENEPLEVAALRLLELAVTASGAGGGRVLLFVGPRLSLSVGAGKTWAVTDDRLAQALGDLLPGMPPEPVSFGRNGRRALVPLGLACAPAHPACALLPPHDWSGRCSSTCKTRG